ncbi:uncharacterized protein LOC129005315 [Macrosteles quadrilineatus]|uniref:uncharacterized protein LOC129005315 n=1 Tax=Macrosteles quadrilineatus TaxID=74068 RepID=UPI0023E3131F|nr:uncharacterized protein LOC129005315 [Macrosteles quadrilineatus]
MASDSDGTVVHYGAVELNDQLLRDWGGTPLAPTSPTQPLTNPLHGGGVPSPHAPGRGARQAAVGRTVFSKLQIKVTTDLIHQIAAGLPGALESVLLAIKNKVDYQQRQKGETDSGQTKTAWGDFGDGSGLNDHEDMFLEIKKLKNEVQLKNETISVLNQKVVHLEALLEIKDKRLRELTANVDRMKARQDDSKESFHSISA